MAAIWVLSIYCLDVTASSRSGVCVKFLRQKKKQCKTHKQHLLVMDVRMQVECLPEKE